MVAVLVPALVLHVMRFSRTARITEIKIIIHMNNLTFDRKIILETRNKTLIIELTLNDARPDPRMITKSE